MLRKYMSRKLIVTVGAIAIALVAAATGEQSWTQATTQIVSAAIAYTAVQGYVDGQATKPPTE